MTLLNKSLKSILIAGLVASPIIAVAETAEEKGMRIAVEAKASDKGWQDMQANMNMILRNKLGQESIREIRMKSLEVEGDGDKSLSVFDKPRDVKGTAFLSFSHAIGADDQWLYLPKLKRVKRIASRNKSGPFMGSEFSYEDLSSFEVEKYTYKFIKDEACEGGTCYVVEQYPVDKNSGYTRRVVWLDQKEYRPWKIDFYDRKDSPLKTLTYHNYQEYKEKHWRPDLMKMINHQSGKSTDLTYGSYTFQTGLSDNDFNKNTLKRAR